MWTPTQGRYPRNYAKMLPKKEEKAVPSAGKVLSKSQFQGLLTSSLLLFLCLAPGKKKSLKLETSHLCVQYQKQLNQTQVGRLLRKIYFFSEKLSFRIQRNIMINIMISPTFLMGKSFMKSSTACLSGEILHCPLGLLRSLHIFANIVFGAIP